MSLISLHEKKRTERNPTKWILVMGWGCGSWYRKLAHIGAKYTPVAVRRMNEDEQQALDNSMRLTYFPYNNIKELMEDEVGRSTDKEWYAKLEELAKKEST